MSRLLGGVGELLFFASLCLLGVIWLAVLITLQVSLSTPDEYYYGVVGFCLRLFAAAALILVGALRSISTVWQASCSIERRSAMLGGQVKSKEAKHSSTAPRFPTIPLDDDLINSPGTILRYRLPCESSPNSRLLGATAICLVLLGVASVTTVLAGETIRARDPDWLMIVVAVASMLSAGWSIFHLFVTLLRFTAIGPTSLEVSDHPLFPDQAMRLSLTQTGRMTLRRIEISLVCWEETIYQQGTNVRTERRDVFRQRVFEDKDITVDPNQAYQTNIDLRIPPRIMHSFQSENNSIEWKFLVRGVAVRFSRFERAFPIVVFPRQLHSTVPSSPAHQTQTRWNH